MIARKALSPSNALSWLTLLLPCCFLHVTPYGLLHCHPDWWHVGLSYRLLLPSAAPSRGILRWLSSALGWVGGKVCCSSWSRLLGAQPSAPQISSLLLVPSHPCPITSLPQSGLLRSQLQPLCQLRGSSMLGEALGELLGIISISFDPGTLQVKN